MSQILAVRLFKFEVYIKFSIKKRSAFDFSLVSIAVLQNVGKTNI